VERKFQDPTIDSWIYGIAAARENHVAVAGKSVPGSGWIVLLDGEGQTVAEHSVGEVAQDVTSLEDGDFLAVGASGGDDATVYAPEYPQLEAPSEPGNETTDRGRPPTTSGPGSGFVVDAAVFALALVAARVTLRRR
jgi:hypothetical protein